MDPIKQAAAGNSDFFRVAETKDVLRARDRFGHSVLYRAVESGHLECSKVIMGRFPELLYVARQDGYTPLHSAIYYQREFVKFLVVGAEKKVFRMAPSQDTPLHMAIDLGYLDIVKILIGADPDFDSIPANSKGETPQVLAVRLASDKDTKTEIRVQIKDYIIQKIDEKNAPPRDLNAEAVDRATKGDVDFFNRVQHQVGIDSRDKNGDSVLSVAVLNGHFECSKVILQRFPELLYLKSTIEKRTPLHHAASRGIAEIVDLLLVGADKKLFRMQNICGDTPMHMAIWEKRLEMVKILAKADPDYNQIPANNNGETPLVMAQRLASGKTNDDVAVKIRDVLVGKQTGTENAKEETTSDVEKIVPTAREHELSIPLRYVDLYSRLVKQFGEIVPLKTDKFEDGPIRNALANFLDMVAEMQVEIPEHMTEEKLSKWERKYYSCVEWGLQINWFLHRIEWYRDRLDNRVNEKLKENTHLGRSTFDFKLVIVVVVHLIFLIIVGLCFF